MSKDKNRNTDSPQRSIIDYIIKLNSEHQSPHKMSKITQLDTFRKDIPLKKRQAIDKVISYSKSLDW